ncbi:MAG: CsgG/HfaB family protein, partial [Candidatus Omnitrophica bacterium]|nr:CsgG/HfaB family protein [Candidatus Omnitrophota bacterium]
MKRVICWLGVFLFFVIFTAFAQEPPSSKSKILLLISEQNIGMPQRSWWASEVDLSTVEAKVANKLITSGYTVLDPSDLEKIVKQDAGFKVVGISEKKSIKLAKLANAEFVVLGKAIASSGSNVPESNMRSFFANVSAKVIRVKTGKILGYLESAGNS